MEQPPTRPSDPLASTQTIRLALKGDSRASNRLEFLAKLPVVLNSSLNTAKVIKVALERIQEELKAEQVAIYLRTEEGQTLEYQRRTLGDSGAETGRIPAPADGMLGWVLASGRTLHIGTEGEGPLLQQIGRPLPEVRTAVVVPLIVRGGESLGILAVQNRDDGSFFSADDVSFVEQFSHQLALALDNARLFQETKEKNDRLLVLDQHKNEMISLIAHEFRTPLNIIQNAAELILDENLDEEMKGRLAGFLKNGVNRLTRLLAQVRRLSLLQGEELTLNREAVNLPELLAELAVYYRQPAGSREITLRLEECTGAGAVSADPELLTLVLQNLIANAIRFTPDGGEVVLRLVRREAEVEIQVQDTGIGIPESEIPMIFEKFYEVGDIMQHTSGLYEFRSGGLGLGLPIAKHILTAHGSMLQVKSRLNEGSLFFFRLPLA